MQKRMWGVTRKTTLFYIYLKLEIGWFLIDDQFIVLFLPFLSSEENYDAPKCTSW